MQIIELDTNRINLEFLPDEADAVFAQLRGVDDNLSRIAHATYDLVTVGNEDLILMNDWDEPCLISLSPAGDALLCGIEAAIGASLRSAGSVRSPDKVRAA